MKLENKPKDYSCSDCGDVLTRDNWLMYDREVKSQCRKCFSEAVRLHRYERIAKETYSHVKYLNSLKPQFRPPSFIAMVRKGRISGERLAHILRTVDFKRDVDNVVGEWKEGEP